MSWIDSGEAPIQKLGTICVCQSRTVEAGVFNSKGVPAEWYGEPPLSINFHDVPKSSWWHDVPHCSLPHHCAMIYPLPAIMKGWALLSICVPLLQRWPSAVAAFFRITNIIRWGPFIWEKSLHSIPRNHQLTIFAIFVTRIPGLCKWWLVLYTKEVVQKQRTLISVDAQRLPTRAQCGGIARG